ncbi:hypothetical protein BBBOND_0100630 [Babesia bigemina]|uniref:Uncharacterized protein n=1 Tax=Babesia bigemina TaxID=5866 RepID=A0A061D428_BABBI|nr:hypothetical protein BBBOND_0100630 [Babesia bigemina]CDR93734.1 hypothetical protein BBBOND_0100630 [Babesia bigemina]|eukprot:XP_012765920.1 hypothetical protein BBBOND_0100630 [Babesia bigemina]
MAYASLTEAPRNVKEGIDWLIALKGDDAGRNLTSMGLAIYNLLTHKPVGNLNKPAPEKVEEGSEEVEGQSGQESVQSLREMSTRALAENLAKLSNNERLAVRIIALKLSHVILACQQFLDDVKDGDRYVSAYGPEATWDVSCAENPEECVSVFVDVAPMLHGGLKALRKASDGKILGIPSAEDTERVQEIMKAFGYNESEERAEMTATHVSEALRGVKKIFGTLHDIAILCAL